ncbi:hypothetical protein QUF90_14850 [Desulfococcaceae bacterium HSG9]|nr:hypothetical protein [Desulfococcaceae bacterium HSG9]
MASNKSMTSLLKENKKLFIIMAVGLLLIELEIFAFAAIKSGTETWLQVIDKEGNVIHETDGGNLSDFNKYYFEKTFGPLSQYKVKHVKKDIPFPFRAWFVAAVGIPIGMMLLFGFVVRAYVSLFYGDKGSEDKTDAPQKDKQSDEETRLEKILSRISRHNIFIIGGIVLMGLFAYWVIPNLITDIGKLGVDTIIRFKWFFLGAFTLFSAVIIWLLYLRYLLAKKSIDSRTEIDKHRIQLEMSRASDVANQLEYNPAAIQAIPETTSGEPDQKAAPDNNG